MTAKEYLNQLKTLNDVIRIKTKNVRELESALIYVSPVNSDMPHSQSDPKNKRTDSLCKLLDLKAELEAAIVKQAKIAADATGMIETINDSMIKWVLYARYMDGMNWKRIAGKSGYSMRHILRLHGDGLVELTRRFKFQMSQNVTSCR